MNKYTTNVCQILTLKFCYNNLKVCWTTIYVKLNTFNEKLGTSLWSHFEKIVIPEGYMSVIYDYLYINHHTVLSKLKTLLPFDLHYVENAKCSRETKTSNSCIDAVYSNKKIDLKVSPTTLTDHYTLFFGFSGHKLNHSGKENDDDRLIKMWTKLKDPNAILNLQFYMQHEIQKFELTLAQLWRSHEKFSVSLE